MTGESRQCACGRTYTLPLPYDAANPEIRFIKGRVRFVGYDEEGNQVKNSPTFSSCVVIFNRDLSRGYPIIGKTIEQPKRVKPEQHENTGAGKE